MLLYRTVEIVYGFRIFFPSLRNANYLYWDSTIWYKLTWWPRRASNVGSCYLHCLGRKFSCDSRELIRFSSLFAPGPGLRIVELPATEHGSDPFFLLPMHQPPGTNMSCPRPNKLASILSRTGSSWRNFLAKGALLSIILGMSAMVRMWGCCLGGLSHDMKWRSWLTVVLRNSWALHMTVWK